MKFVYLARQSSCGLLDKQGRARNQEEDEEEEEEVQGADRVAARKGYNFITARDQYVRML